MKCEPKKKEEKKKKRNTQRHENEIVEIFCVICIFNRSTNRNSFNKTEKYEIKETKSTFAISKYNNKVLENISLILSFFLSLSLSFSQVTDEAKVPLNVTNDNKNVFKNKDHHTTIYIYIYVYILYIYAIRYN